MKKIIRLAVGKSAYLAYTALNLTHMRKKDRIIFVSFPPASDNSWYLYKHALKELENFELIWLVDSNSHEIKNKILSEAEKSPNHNSVKILNRWSLRGLNAFCSSKFVFHTHGSYFFIGPSILSPTIVNLWHGMPIKAIGHLDKELKKNFTYSDYSIATSEYYRTLMAQAFGLSKNQVLPTGLPRNDILFKLLSLNEKNKIIDTLKVENNDSLVVWL
ncbi:CDP-glycerol glycerophosphotransferase family protein, partial [Psychrobacter piechaudii]|uniref:CDP-glycerol glycerophosphotransferase family protein n=1 Tax=Psychrobacter piechaudii TaxID=1945521 RepID=UPI001ABFB0F7